MHIIYLSIFPEIFESFLATSLVEKAQQDGSVEFSSINPRDFCTDKHKQIDDEPYWGWAGLVMKAQPVIDAITKATTGLEAWTFAVILPWPSREVFTQSTAHRLAEYDTLVFVAGRYEGIDHRCALRARDQFGNDFYELSLWQFVTLWWETPAMVMTESIIRLLPWVIWDDQSRKNESYRPEQWETNIEHPHYTRPQEVAWYTVPDVLLSGNHAKIEEWRDEMGE